jgi:hypothetical protein
MTSTAMLYEWRLGFDILASGAAPGFTDGQVYAILNKSQDYIIKECLEKKDLLSINTIIIDSSVAASGGTNKLYYRALPADYWLYIESHSGLTRTALGNSGFIPTLVIATETSITNEPIDPDQAVNFLPSAFNSLRIFKSPKVYPETNNLYVIADDYTTIVNIILRYARKRATIANAVDCELPEIMHRKVVDKAIDIAKTIINVQTPQDNS